MTALVACETLLLVLLVLLVAGLLRSHAEILRRLGPPGEESPGGGRGLPSPGARNGTRAHELAAVTLDGDAVKVGFGLSSPPTLLAFLTSGCTVCETFWHDLREGKLPADIAGSVRLLAVTKDSSHESPSRLGELAGPDVQIMMSSAAWTDYRVPAAPYFVYVVGEEIQGEGSATGWMQIASLLRDATADHANGSAGEQRATEADRVLAASGIGPGHTSLYPSAHRSQEKRT